MITSLLKHAIFQHQIRSNRRCEWLAHRLVSMHCPSPPPHTFTGRDELTQLFRLAFCVPADGCILEIGSYLGASARYLGTAATIQNRKLYCIDTWNNETMPDGIKDTLREFKRNVAGIESALVLVQKPSQRLDRSDIDDSVSLAFIDGDHSYEACRQDWRFVSTVMHSNGIVAFHDTSSFPGVSRVVGEILASGDWRLGGMCGTLTWIHRSTWA